MEKFKTNIHQNKDWNVFLKQPAEKVQRFKTNIHQNKDWNGFFEPNEKIWIGKFKTNIHQNKDWNKMVKQQIYNDDDGLRPTSIKTRIETLTIFSV